MQFFKGGVFVAVVKYVFDCIIEVMSTNLNVFNYRITLLEILLFVVLGGLALALIFNIAE